MLVVVWNLALARVLTALRGGRWQRLIVVLLTLSVAASDCATIQAQSTSHTIPGITTPVTVFVADGAGNFQVTSRTLRAVAQSDGYPLKIATFKWSHGYGRVIADQICFSHARTEGKLL